MLASKEFYEYILRSEDEEFETTTVTTDCTSPGNRAALDKHLILDVTQNLDQIAVFQAQWQLMHFISARMNMLTTHTLVVR